jgi:cell shape-determining protein MreC
MATKKKRPTLDQKLDAVTNIVEKGFAAVASDIADIRENMATKADLAEVRRKLKGDIATLHLQVNSIDAQLRQTKIEVRLGDLEEKVFGRAH